MPNGSSSPEVARAPRGRRWRRILLALTLGLVVGLLAAEGCLRFLLFSDSDLAVSAGARLRNAHHFSRPRASLDFHKLRYLLREPSKRRPPANLDPLLGWRMRRISPGSYDHLGRASVGDRRPFLMYGDSFTACMLPPADCWDGLMGQTDLADTLAVINYGCRAHGLGQMYLLLRESIDSWTAEGPVVSIGILVDDDLDRSVLEFREGPKPEFDVADGQLSIVYPGDQAPDEWLAEHPPQIASYMWAYLVYGTNLFPGTLGPLRRESEHLVHRKQEVTRLLIEAIAEILESRGLDYFFILYEGPLTPRTRNLRRGWRWRFLTTTLDQHGIPWVSAPLALERDRQQTGKQGNADYFIPPGTPSAEHYSLEGNKAAMDCVLQGLRGDFDGAIKHLSRDPALWRSK